MLTTKAVVLAVVAAGLLGFLLRATGYMWTWPLALAIVLAALWASSVQKKCRF